ncbi:hypothetical protein [Nonlabens antarcticus]|uniref:hypothetical protein n=1 Tax=Nonlabens antarcticus TaxID=392714 RepID=UPI0018913D61|nr:hypothetical protein [Nonlabens antarcticus]
MAKESYDYTLNNYYQLIIGFNAVAFSFCFTTSLWMGNIRAINRNKTRKLRMAAANSKWVIYSVLAILGKMLFYIASAGINLERDYYYLGFIIPLFLVLYCWNLISTVYKIWPVFPLVLLILVVFSLILSFI